MQFISKNLKYLLPVLIVLLFIVLVKGKNQPNCEVAQAVLNTPSIEDTTANLSWTNGQNSKEVYLNISTSNSLKSDKSLEVADIVNDVVTGQTSYSRMDLEPGTYYWNIASDGCGQRKISELGTFVVKSTTELTTDAICEIAPAILNAPKIENSTVTLSWTKSKDTKVAYINISTSEEVNADGLLQEVNIANDVVSGKSSYTRENLPDGTYYWNIASDGCGQRKMSELSSFTIQATTE